MADLFNATKYLEENHTDREKTKCSRDFIVVFTDLVKKFGNDKYDDLKSIARLWVGLVDIN